MTAKEKFSRNASDIWLDTNMSLTLLKAKGVFLFFWVYNAATLQPELTLRHMKQTQEDTLIWHFRAGNYIGDLCLNQLAKYFNKNESNQYFFFRAT